MFECTWSPSGYDVKTLGRRQKNSCFAYSWPKSLLQVAWRNLTPSFGVAGVLIARSEGQESQHD
jgi:hypothetical protein